MKVLATQLALGAVLALASFAPWRAPIVVPTEVTTDNDSSDYATATKIKVWNESYGSDDDDTCLLEVQGVLDPVLKSLSRESPVPRIRAALEARYGVAVVETALAPHYVVLWLDGRWMVVCLQASSFEVDFDDRGEVYVEIEEHLPM